VVEAVRRVQSSELLQVRVGLATGLAVVGDLIGTGAAQEQAVIGDTPNLAARLQALAGPDQIMMPENTRRLVGNLFEYDSLGELEVKGLPAPVLVFRVVRGQSLRGTAHWRDAACRPRRGNRATQPPLGSGEGWEGPGGPSLCRAGDR
jgi:class 3 adenylate cyclase